VEHTLTINTLVCVGAEVVALCLGEVSRQPGTTVCIKVRQTAMIQQESQHTTKPDAFTDICETKRTENNGGMTQDDRQTKDGYYG
jgi:hypothetical protein